MGDWRKSSYSDASGGNCVEVATGWRKSAYSDASGGQCVEVASGDMILVRDTTNRDGATLGFSATAWEQFLRTVR
jgi:Domain of unknown function (DUF397)